MPNQKDTAVAEIDRALVEMASRLGTVIADTVGPYVKRITEGMRRAANLAVSASEVEAYNPSGAQDMLRAAVVLNHAYLEDVLRTLASTLLPEAEEAVLNHIPIAGGTGRAEKVPLGMLARHKGKTVEDVIRESVAAYLANSNFNHVSEIAHLLENLGFDVAQHNTEFPKLEEMMQRRHQIVHRADRVKAAGSDEYVLEAIRPAEVRDWLDATSNFIRGLMQPLFLRLYPLEKLKEMFNLNVVKKGP
jgi:hypothetical protein